MSSVHLDANATTTVEIHFLPFNIGERQCSVIFLNEEIGEFLYSIEAKSTLPLPDALPFVKTGHSVRISSAAAAGKDILLNQYCLCLNLTNVHHQFHLQKKLIETSPFCLTFTEDQILFAVM